MTLDQLAERTGLPHHDLAFVLRDEQSLGRVSVNGGDYALNPAAFPGDVVEALRGLTPDA